MPTPSGGLHKELFGTLLTDIDTTAKEDVGALRADENGNIYIYLQGVADVVLGDWCIFRITSKTANTLVRALADVVGPLAIALGAVVASRWGWFQVVGFNDSCGAISGGGAAAAKLPYLTATPGLIDDVIVVGDVIYGAHITVAESSALVGCTLSNPFVTNISN